MTEVALDRTVRVERILYLNPFDLNITFDGSGIKLRLLPGKLKPAQAPTTKTFGFKRDIHDAFRGALLSGELRIGSEEVTRLLTGDIQRSLGKLVDADMDVELQEVRDGDPEDEQ